ncbi:hypothetical protein EMCG_07357 [[Emmonsia] crescens]|uniref:Uncharacterized protein n=1 Tax=[Emmonsia] crescens TaxID=73230 RepID=A0A0G2I9Q1_9EURO|nr:hypothetical protein EMCG_07357 [Emmonsia crescens UAMH 3008]
MSAWCPEDQLKARDATVDYLTSNFQIEHNARSYFDFCNQLSIGFKLASVDKSKLGFILLHKGPILIETAHGNINKLWPSTRDPQLSPNFNHQPLTANLLAS